MNYLYETHFHTSEVSLCGRGAGVEMIKEYKNQGYAGVIVTDHFLNGNCRVPKRLPWPERVEGLMAGYEACKEQGRQMGLSVFFGWEFPYQSADLLTYGLGKQWLLSHPDMLQWSIKRYFQEVHAAGGMMIQAHPFREAPWITEPAPVFEQSVDGLEVFNCHNPTSEADQKALALARKNHMRMTCGSDAHAVSDIMGWGMAFDHSLRDIYDFIDSLKKPETYRLAANRV